jgi:hypothetical protein
MLCIKTNFDNDDMITISENIKKYDKLFKDIADSVVGKYPINVILEAVEEALNYMEIFGPVIKKWAVDYLEKHRGELWLSYGIQKGSYLADYWKIQETNMAALRAEWPFLFNKSVYKGFIIDLAGAQEEIVRQRKRQDRANPNYKSFHPDGCPSDGCSCWMLDDMEQWYEEEQTEIKESKNIFFNQNLQNDFYKVACENLGELKEQWENWQPVKDARLGTVKSKLDMTQGQTPITIILSWIKNDFGFSSPLSMFSWRDVFQRVWNSIDDIEEFVKYQRQKLKTILEIL